MKLGFMRQSSWKKAEPSRTSVRTRGLLMTVAVYWVGWPAR